MILTINKEEQMAKMHVSINLLETNALQKLKKGLNPNGRFVVKAEYVSRCKVNVRILEA